MSTVSSLLILVLVSVLLTALPLVSAWNDMPSQCPQGSQNFTTTTNYPDSQFTGATDALVPGTIRLSAITITKYQTIYDLGFSIGQGSANGTVNIAIGLYSADAVVANKFNILGQTNNYPLSVGEANSPYDGSLALQMGVSVVPGTYYISITADANGVFLASGSTSVDGTTYNYDHTAPTLPASITVTASFKAFKALTFGCNTTAPKPNVRGDPLFSGFHGQVYQVHGIPNMIFNLLSASTLQLNSRFILIKDGESMTVGQQKDAVMTSKVNSLKNARVSVLPDTAAWSHTGTYLGETGLTLSNTHIYVKPGMFSKGFDTITMNGQSIVLSAITSYPFILFSDDMNTVTITSTHIIHIHTSLLSFDIVNSDGFVNIDNARLSASAFLAEVGTTLDGILGQSADPTRYFPAYTPIHHGIIDTWTSAMKDDFQQHQQMDYLLDEATVAGLFSTHFNNNLFNQ